MLKQAILAASLLIASSYASAAIVVTDSSVTGADMAGMEVTVTFASGLTESAIWQVVNNTPVPVSSGNASIDAEVLSGGAFGSTWELTQAGFSLGAIDATGALFGDWVLSNMSSAEAITALSVNGLPGGVAFDIIAGTVGNTSTDGTPNSLGGLAFISEAATGSYDNQVSPAFSDLFWQLDVALGQGLTAGQSMIYFADTDLVDVPAPATLGLLIGSLLLFSRSKRVASKA